MVGAAINLVIGCTLVLWGWLVLHQRPSTTWFMDWLQGCANTFMGGEYCVPFYIVGLCFIVLGGFALFNGCMIIAETYGFWIV